MLAEKLRFFFMSNENVVELISGMARTLLNHRRPYLTSTIDIIKIDELIHEHLFFL